MSIRTHAENVVAALEALDREVASAVAAERSRIYREVVEPLVEALENVLTNAPTNEFLAETPWHRGFKGRTSLDVRLYIQDILDARAALATAREQMGKP